MLLGDEPVFDGPATNAMSHVLNNVLFFAAASTNAVTAVPEMVTGEFYRARHDIESYDLASISGSFANGIRFVGTLGHCCAAPVPFEIRVSGCRTPPSPGRLTPRHRRLHANREHGTRLVRGDP